MSKAVALSDKEKMILAALAKVINGALGVKPAKAADEDAADDSADDAGDGDDAGDDAGDGDDGDGDDAGDGDDGDGDDSGLGDDGDGEDAGPTRDDVRASLRAYAAKVKSQDRAVALMKKVGGTDALTKLKPAKFAAVIAAAKKATKDFGKKK